MAVHLSEQSKAEYSDYLKRFKEDPNSISTEEAVQRYQELVRHAPPELAAEADQHVMGLLPQNEQEVLASNIHGSGSQQHFGLDNILGKDSVLNTPLGRMILSAAVAYLMNRMLGQPQSQVGTRAPSGGLGDLIGSILGGAAGGQGQVGTQLPSSTSTDGGLPSGLGDILGAILGGQSQAGSQTPSGGLPGGLGDILGGLLGGSPDAPADEPEEQQPPVRTHRKQ